MGALIGIVIFLMIMTLLLQYLITFARLYDGEFKTKRAFFKSFIPYYWAPAFVRNTIDRLKDLA